MNGYLNIYNKNDKTDKLETTINNNYIINLINEMGKLNIDIKNFINNVNDSSEYNINIFTNFINGKKIKNEKIIIDGEELDLHSNNSNHTFKKMSCNQFY